jgi:hypothetical protein
VAAGTPEEVAANPASVTGRYLGPLLARGTGTPHATVASPAAKKPRAKRAAKPS